MTRKRRKPVYWVAGEPLPTAEEVPIRSILTGEPTGFYRGDPRGRGRASGRHTIVERDGGREIAVFGDMARRDYAVHAVKHYMSLVEMLEQSVETLKRMHQLLVSVGRAPDTSCVEQMGNILGVLDAAGERKASKPKKRRQRAT